VQLSLVVLTFVVIGLALPGTIERPTDFTSPSALLLAAGAWLAAVVEILRRNKV
jgi:hypothetical protein